MSVIREALRRESGNGPSWVPSGTAPENQGPEKKGGGSRRKGWILGGLFLGLAIGGIGYFLFYRPAGGPSLGSTIPQPKTQVLAGLSVPALPTQAKRAEPDQRPSLVPPRTGAVFHPRPTLSREKKGKAGGQEARKKSFQGAEPSSAEQREGEPTARHWFTEAIRAQEQKDYDRAISAYEKVLALRPYHVETYNNLGLILLEQGRPALAREMFEKALILRPRYWKGMNNLGLAYLKEGRLEEAGDQFRKVLEGDSGFLPALVNLAAVYSRQGQREQARKVLLKVLDHKADHPEACYNLGLLWEMEGAEDKALPYYRTFIAQAQGPNRALAEALKTRFPELR